MCKESRTVFFATGFVVGAISGALLALMLAPARGDEVRRQVRRQSLKLGERSIEAMRKVASRSKEAAIQGRGRLTLAVQKLRTRFRSQEGLPSERNAAQSRNLPMESK